MKEPLLATKESDVLVVVVHLAFRQKNYYLNYFINEFHLSFYNGHSEFIFFPIKVRILLEAGALVECSSANSEDVGI